jgi:hypothetical protein
LVVQEAVQVLREAAEAQQDVLEHNWPEKPYIK